MKHLLDSTGDCKSLIREFDSRPRLQNIAEVSEEDCATKKLTVWSGKVSVGLLMPLPVDVIINYKTNGLSLHFTYKSKKYNLRLNCSLDELTEAEVSSIVKKKIMDIDSLISIRDCFDKIEACDDCGGNQETRHRAITDAKDMFRRDGIDLDSPTSVLLNIDDHGRTLPERWSEIYGLPHKLRRIKSLFSKKNIRLFIRWGWDTSHFGSFVAFSATSVVSQPFTTTDTEVEHIKEVFTKAKYQHPVFYDIYMLAFGAGLRQSEIYQVKYEDFTTFGGQHYLLLPFATKRSRLKGTTHMEKVGISSQLHNHFTSRGKTGEVISGAKRLHKRFIKFLRNEVGITDDKPCHRLRKILGARLATTAGIYHAAKTLRNSVGVAERYYSDLTSHRNELEV